MLVENLDIYHYVLKFTILTIYPPDLKYHYVIVLS